MPGVLPTTIQVEDARADISTFLVEGQTLGEHLGTALKSLKRDLYNIRGFQFDQIYTGDDATGTYLSENNQDQCHQMLIYLAIALVFRGYAIKADNDSQWYNMANSYRQDYDDLLQVAKLDLGPPVEVASDTTPAAPNTFWRL